MTDFRRQEEDRRDAAERLLAHGVGLAIWVFVTFLIWWFQ